MKVLKYKKLTGGKYKVTLDTMDIVLYEEVILKYNLLITKEIDPLEIEKISNDNMFYEIYYVAIKSINSRIKSVYDIRMFLKKKEYPIDIIESVIDKLLEQGYLNDLIFTKSFINNQIVTTNNGPNKIRKELLDHRVDEKIIYNELESFTTDIQLEKIEKLINRFYKSNHTRGGFVLKKKITNDLLNYGYDMELIDKEINKFDFSNDKDIAKKEYGKLYRKLSKKYNGVELERKIKEKMYMKGLVYEEDI
ncbi:MAG: RecX family transcriptional regulator [Bacilli bacterium]|nr:RecX family transcriptional regulator [Bacilli bacterium]